VISELDLVETDFDKAVYLQKMLLERSTGGEPSEAKYELVRFELMSNPKHADLLPDWLKQCRTLGQFWQYIKHEFSSYADRRKYLYDELNPILEYLEFHQTPSVENNIDEILSAFDSDGIHFSWKKALERKSQDPAGAITISRSILESVCKHILNGLSVPFNETNIDLSELYKLTANELNLAPEQHSEKIFKQILGGCSGIINGLGTLRNKHGDAHGTGPIAAKPKTRHAELAVNLAGSMAVFLIQTYEEKTYQIVASDNLAE
jgi:hypothetical protein